MIRIISSFNKASSSMNSVSFCMTHVGDPWILLPPKLYLVVFYQVSLVNRTGITCSDFREPSVLLPGSFIVSYHMFIPHGGIVIDVLA